MKPGSRTDSPFFILEILYQAVDASRHDNLVMVAHDTFTSGPLNTDCQEPREANRHDIHSMLLVAHKQMELNFGHAENHYA
jgi:hypothetical protein